MAVNDAEILIGPIRSGAHERVKRMLVQFNIEIVAVDTALAERAASVRVRTNLKFLTRSRSPRRFTPSTGGHSDVELAGFGDGVLNVYMSLQQRRLDSA